MKNTMNGFSSGILRNSQRGELDISMVLVNMANIYFGMQQKLSRYAAV